MKKFIYWMLCLALILSLCACGARPETVETADEAMEETTASEQTEELAADEAHDIEEAYEPDESDETETAASGSDLPAIDTTEPADASDSDLTEPTSEAYTIAQGLVGETVETLYEAIGEPTGGSEYASSCLVEGADDGMLYYDDFYVFTVRTETEETVEAILTY